MPSLHPVLHPAWLDALKNPATYPHPVSQIQMTETHISWVALTGDWAYKLKKPVGFGFVDFSTLELRLAACREEIRLNRRTAPDMYDDVVPLADSPAGPRFGGTGPVLEYAVRMRQFRQEDMLDQSLARGELTADIINILASEVAELHRAADVASAESAFGDPGSIHANVQECLDCLQDFCRSDALRPQFDRLTAWTNVEWRQLQETFDIRKRQGWVRECHGDLHLGNLVLFQGRPTMFDCLEFNPQLRWVDVMSDVAFLVMDLLDRSAAPLAWRLLNEWLQQTGDYHGLYVLKYYVVYRALVRAKVAALRMQQPDISALEIQQQQEHVRSYVDLATMQTQSNRPAILLMHGVSGSGKSFAASQLAASLGAIQVRSDVERKRLFNVWPASAHLTPPPPEMYAPQATQETYLRLQSLARIVVGAGLTVIVDATFLRHADRLAFAAIACELSVPMIIVSCSAAESLLRDRVTQRQTDGQDPSDADTGVLEKQLLAVEPLDPVESRWSVSINSVGNNNVEKAVPAIRELIRQASIS